MPFSQNCQIPARRLKNGPPSGQTATYRKTEVIQSYLRIWGTYDPIESGPSDPKKWGLYRRSVKKCRFSGQNRAPAAAPRPAVQRGQHKNVVFLLSGHDGNKKVGRHWQKNGFWAEKIEFLARNSAFLDALASLAFTLVSKSVSQSVSRSFKFRSPKSCN